VSDQVELVQGWFRVTQPEPGILTIEEPLHEERVKSYLIEGGRRAVLLDAGMGVGDLGALVAELTALPVTLVVSHAHWDHVGGCHAFVGRSEILVHPEQADRLAEGVPAERMRRRLPEGLLGELPAGFDLDRAAIPPVQATGHLLGGETLDLGGRALEVIAAPGHAPGLLALLDRATGVLFSTDAAYAGALYAQFPDSDLDAYRATLATLAALAPSLRTVYPAHGDSPMSPALLPAMRDSVEQVAAGRQPEAVADGVAHHQFAGFSVLVAAAGR
jgi:glyoxylase-like metal-dependent hydrolase (beta-lactamase superfamily II)